MKKIKLLGDRVVIKLDELEDHTTTESGLIVPLSTVYETDSGRIKARTSAQKHIYEGVITDISPKAQELSALNVGDRVYVSDNVLSSKAFHFYYDRSKLVQTFEGYVCVPHTLIEAIVTNEN
jgi:co-chaperonin GroES (HSP10)